MNREKDPSFLTPVIFSHSSVEERENYIVLNRPLPPIPDREYANIWCIGGRGYSGPESGKEVKVTTPMGRGLSPLQNLNPPTPRQSCKDLQDSLRRTFRLNHLAGHEANAGWEAIDHQMKIVSEEWREMTEDGIEARNVVEFRDGLADLIFTLFGLAYRAGIPLTNDVAAVVDSNTTKYDDSWEDALKTCAKYSDLGVSTYCIHRTKDKYGVDKWVTYSASDQHDINGKFYFKGKWLKSYRFETPQFIPLPSSTERLLGDIDDDNQSE